MRAVIVGSSGGIGGALVDALQLREDLDALYALSRSGDVPSVTDVHGLKIDIVDESSVAAAARKVSSDGPLDLVIVASGVLSDGGELQPEKSWRDQSMSAFERVFKVNTFGPALVAKHFLPLLPRKGRAVFAVLSARVGSISDNGLGGWHAYRASKAALNMLVRNYALELARKNSEAVCIGLHPGTVATVLSAPFASGAANTVFSPEQAATNLLSVIGGLAPSDTGKVFDWKQEEIPA